MSEPRSTPDKGLAHVLEMLRERIEKAGSLRTCANQMAISAAYLSDIMNRRREPGPSVLKHLGVKKIAKREVAYVWDLRFKSSNRSSR